MSAIPPDHPLLREGEAVPASGNRPSLLDDPESAWVVERGKVEIFAVGVVAGEPVGARTHYLSVEPGQAFFGMNLRRAKADAGFLAVGRMGTLLRRIPIPRLRELGRDGEAAPAVAELLDTWIEGLSERLVRNIVQRPQVEVSLSAGQELELSEGHKARSARGVVWLTRERGDLLFAGIESLKAGQRRAFPLTPTTWVEASNEAGVKTSIGTHTTLSLLPAAALWRGLEFFHEALCRAEFINKKLALVDDLNRLRSRTAEVLRAEEVAAASLAAVLDPGLEAEPPSAADAHADFVFRAMSRLARAQGIELREHPDRRDEGGFDARVEAIAKASGIRVRRILLRGAWWQKDQGPFLGRSEAGGHPVALLPSGPTSYQLADPASGKPRAVTEEVAASLSAFGYVLYRPFPSGVLLTVREIVRFGARGLKGDFSTLLGMGVLLGILGALVPYFTGRVFDFAIPEAERGILVQFALAMAVAAFASAAFRLTQAIATLRIEGLMDYAIQASLWDRLLNLPSTFFRQYSAGDLADRAGGINTIRGLLSEAGISATLGLFSSLFYVVLMFWYSAELALLAMALTLAFVAFTTVANLLQLRHQRREFTLRGKIAGLVFQLISGVSHLRIAGAESHAIRVWAQKFAEQRRISYTIGRIQNAVQVFNVGFPVLSSMALFAVLINVNEEAAKNAQDAALKTGDFIAFSAAYGLFLAAVQALSEASLNLIRAVPTWERLRPILDTAPEVDESKAHPGSLKGEIDLSHLHFRYQEDGPWVLRDVSLTIRPGEFVAFVGASGSGKSTLLRLMLGFEKPEKGSIYFDGQDLANLDLRAVRQQLGVVLQDSKLLPADIFRNITGATARSLEDAWEAARLAGLDQDVREMPMGMHTYISEGGGGLSGGQRQRLLIARALVNRPRILFFDEATSALDNRSQAIVTESLEDLHATRIVIAHRLTTIQNADRICVLDNGVIREMGTYEELIQRDGLFAQLARRQMV